jgi:hypothetical protein
MKVITAPESIDKINRKSVSVFLAGGICNCPWWQKDVIKKLEQKGFEGYVFNPRRENFPMHDPKAAYEQIKWEYEALNEAKIFSMWFCAGESDQPICMYELGRNIALHSIGGSPFIYTEPFTHVAVGIEPGYKREQDVRIQLSLINEELADRISNNLEEHVENIILCAKSCSDLNL